MTLVRIVVVLLLIPVMPSVGWTQENSQEEVIAAAERGRRLFDSGEYQEAIDFLTQAYETHQEAIFFQYIGRCYQELEDYCRAAEFYRRFLHEARPPAEIREQLEANLETLDRQCSRPQVERVEVAVDTEQELELPLLFSHQEREQARERPRTDIASYILFGLGSGTFIPGVILWIASLVTYYEYKDNDQGLENPAEQWQRYSIPGDVLGFIGAAFLGVGLVVLVVGRRRARSLAQRVLTFGPAGGMNVALTWR